MQGMNSTQAPLWRLEGVSKLFAGIRAMDCVDFSVHKGKIHALIGENGSGKSTLIKCLSGVHQPEEGTIYHNEKPVRIVSPEDARRLGVATIFQEFSLVPTLSVAENIFLGRMSRRAGRIQWNEARQKSREILARLEIDIDPDVLINSLSVAQQQLVEIAKAFSIDASLLIMDEPTAALGLSEIERLHDLVRMLRDRGYAIIYISHRLDEVVDLVDEVTILKDGKNAGYADKDGINVDNIVRLMIGSDIEEHYPKQRNTKDDVLLQAENISTEKGVDDVSLVIRRGEVLGLAGLIGSGRTEIANALFGVDKLISGSMFIDSGQGLKKWNISSPVDAIRNKIAFVSENRKFDGLYINFFAQENVTIVGLKRIVNFFRINLRKEQQVGRETVEQFRISPLALEKSVGYLSGGNQQKIIIARWIFSQAELFILDEPTQGIDVNAKLEVYQLINRLTGEGKGVLLISSDFPELLAMSDTIAVVHNGKIRTITDARQIDRPRLMQLTLAGQDGNKRGDG